MAIFGSWCNPWLSKVKPTKAQETNGMVETPAMMVPLFTENLVVHGLMLNKSKPKKMVYGHKFGLTAESMMLVAVVGHLKL
jgi:hypothetical protein